jgi:hypothetical protein
VKSMCSLSLAPSPNSSLQRFFDLGMDLTH